MMETITIRQGLSDEQILERYGSMIRKALRAFNEDPSYVVQMADHARVIEERRVAQRVTLR